MRLELKQRGATGFSLVEVMIVLVIASSVIATGLTWLSSEQKRSARGDAITTQALEMATLGRALDQYLRSGASIPAETTVQISILDLQHAELIPQNYAVRDRYGTGPTSPLGQEYVLVARRTGEKIRGLVFTVGDPNNPEMTRLGIRPTTEAVGDFHAAVTRLLRTQQYVASAYVRAGTAVADRVVSTFDLDFSQFTGGALVHPTAVALTGFAELSVTPAISVTIDPDSFPVASSPESLTGRECRLTVDESCGADQQLWEHVMCDGWQQVPRLPGTRASVVSLGATVAKVNKHFVINQFSSQGNASARGVGRTFDSQGWTVPHNMNPYRIVSDTVDNPAMAGPTDHFMMLGRFNPHAGTHGGSQFNIRNSATGANWRASRTLPSCGGVNEDETVVYELLSGQFTLVGYDLGATGGGRDATPMQAGAESMSVWDPNALGGVPAINSFAVEEVYLDGVKQAHVVCGGRWLASSNVSGTSFGYSGLPTWLTTASRGSGSDLSSTNACPLRRGIENHNVLSSSSTRPYRAFTVDAGASDTFRYCCSSPKR